MSSISSYGSYGSTKSNAAQDLPLATTADDIAANLTKVRTRLAQNVSKGRLSADDVKEIAAKLKAVGDALKSDGANGVLTRTQVADLASQLNQQNKAITTLGQDGKAQASAGTKVSNPIAQNKTELADRIAKLRTNIANAMKEGTVMGDTAKGLVNGLNSIQKIFAKYDAKGPFTGTQLSDLSKLVDQATNVLRQQSAPGPTPSYAAAPKSGTGLSLVDYLA
jgi:hypothetical protein